MLTATVGAFLQGSGKTAKMSEEIKAKVHTRNPALAKKHPILDTTGRVHRGNVH